MELISQQEAKAQDLKLYFTNKPCKHGHIAERFVRNSVCCACLTEYRNSPKGKATQAAYSKSTARRQAQARHTAKPEVKARNNAYAKTPSRAAKRAAWAKANAEKRKIAEAARHAANPHIKAAANAQRRAQKLQATPVWADRQAIKAIYEQCAFTSRVTGQAHHVDHIIPLQGETVSGLHVPRNLQILTAEANVKKSNKLLDDQVSQ